jgi:hypothetical protein
MADTGSPWFIPFAEPSDLVRDWPALSEAVGTAVAAGLSAAGNAGIGSNVVQTVKTNTFSTTTTDSWVEVTGATVSLTPSSDTSKVLVLAYVTLGFASGGTRVPYVALFRGTTQIFAGDADGSRMVATGGGITGDQEVREVSILFLDSPGTGSAVTYSLRVRGGAAGTTYVGRSGVDSNATTHGRYPTSITAIEVKA